MISIIHVVGKMDRGGLETFVMNVLRNIDSNRFRCDILCTNCGVGDYDAEAQELGARIFNIGDDFQSYRGKLRFVGQFSEYRKWFLAHPYDVIHIHGSHAFDNLIAVEAALDSGCKNVICHSHNSNGMHKLLNGWGASRLRKLPIIRLACSKEAGEWLYGSPDCFEVIKNGVDVGSFEFKDDLREKYRALFNIPNSTKVIAHTGRLVNVKNQAFLLDILAALLDRGSYDWLLFLVGTGEDEEKLREKARNLEIENHVEFLGIRSDVSGILAMADVYVMPSIYEGLPLAAVEAQASGLPTVISKEMSPETILRSSTCMMELALGADAWACAIDELASSARMWDRLLGAQEVRKAGFDISSTVARLESLYELSE